MSGQESKAVPSSSYRAIKHILSSRQPVMLLLKYLLLLVLVVLSLFNVFIGAQALAPPNVYRKDFVQEYVLARAIRAGVNPYLPVDELAEIFVAPASGLVPTYPTPHPPPVAVFSLPLSLLAYEQAAVLWFVLEIACLLLAVYLLLRPSTTDR